MNPSRERNEQSMISSKNNVDLYFRVRFFTGFRFYCNAIRDAGKPSER